MKTEVSFLSAVFNSTESKDYFINDGCFGDDVARWLIARLRAGGLQTADEPDQEDFGWHFTFTAGGAEHCFVIGFQPNYPASGDRWLGWLERNAGFLGSILGARKRGILPEAVEAIDTALKASLDIHGIAWYERGAREDAESDDG